MVQAMTEEKSPRPRGRPPNPMPEPIPDSLQNVIASVVKRRPPAEREAINRPD